ncbi:HEAT repeat domain-containing protein [Pseudofrankia sp. BMG5.37]|uniref:HEAT repeat domain-containing protein n=1 Tax=Pseudofrankia sp. BMG5.37 TaxID=3050035 RepID=UPI0028941EDD|nr:HEAT repeat domain-containing protein [Pseudofrankia sp. BMG5.37]MDT3444894.1 HEAT repeat domain-containing protein [Pseudofrankia sp. BMG5.37]
MSGHETELRVVDDFLRRWREAPVKQRFRLVPDMPVGAIRVAAIHHSDPWVRRACLAFLDHHANDASTRTFLDALADPVTPVRLTALHAVSCERCRDSPLCVADVVPTLAGALRADPSPEVRHKAIPILLGLADRDPRFFELFADAADDPDPLVSDAARAASDGRWRDAARSRHDAIRRRRTRKGKARPERS